MNLVFADATESDVPALALLRTAVARKLTAEHGKGHWSSEVSEAAASRGLRHARVLVARDAGRDGRIVGTLRLATKKPWAIDVAYFTGVPRALYLHDMAVAPEVQGRGIGRRLVEEAKRAARHWPAQAIRLDAYDAPAGAGGFYARCSFTEVGRVVYRANPLVYFELLL